MAVESVPPAAPESLTGKCIGKYAILKPLAMGGMAELFLARSRGIEGFAKLVALKRVRPELSLDEELVRMFLDEARTMATLNHGNIVQVYDIGSIDGSYFFTMEFLHGVDLRAVFKVGRAAKSGMPLEHSLQIVTSTLAALHYAHDKNGPDGTPLGLVHRDVSPANIFVSYEGDVKLLDFGIAKASTQSTQTRAGTLKGKVRYMAPEQVLGQAIDRRCDVFAISIVLWELTTGKRLFAGSNEYETIKQIVEGHVPRPSEVAEGYPPELEAIVMKGLATAPGDRWPTARAMQLELQRFAVAQRLACSPLALSEYVSGLFREQIDAWNAARIEGKDLGEYVVEMNDDWQSSPSGPSSASRRSLSSESITILPRSGRMAVSRTSPEMAAPASRPPRSSRALSIGAVAGIAILGTIGFVATRKPATPSESAAAAAMKPTAETPAAQSSASSRAGASAVVAPAPVVTASAMAPSSASAVGSAVGSASGVVGTSVPAAPATARAWTAQPLATTKKPSTTSTATTAAPTAGTAKKPFDPDDPNL